MNKTKLSIGIPTYNRVTFLEESLKSIIDQIDSSIKDLVEIVISDNCSDDGTDVFISNMIIKNPDIKFVYSKNLVNMGFDYNVNRLFELAGGEYVMCFSDDDILLNGAIKYILNTIELYPQCTVIFISSTGFAAETKYIIASADNESIDKRLVSNNLSEYAARHGDMISGFLSLYTIKRDDWLRNKKRLKYFGSGFIHLYSCADILESSPIYFTNKVLVKARANNVREESHEISTALLTNIHYIGVITKKRDIFPENVYKKIFAKKLRECRIAILYEKGTGKAPPLSVLLSAIWANYDKRNIGFWLIDIPIVVLPHSFYRPFYFLYHFLKSLQKSGI